jgi:hypothetical protein
METAKMPYNQQMDQKNVFVYNGILLSHEVEWNFVIQK